MSDFARMNAAIKGKDKKGNFTVEQVKVERYRAGKEPKRDDDSNKDEDDFVTRIDPKIQDHSIQDHVVVPTDRRLARLSQLQTNTVRNEIQVKTQSKLIQSAPMINSPVQDQTQSSLQSPIEREEIVDDDRNSSTFLLDQQPITLKEQIICNEYGSSSESNEENFCYISEEKRKNYKTQMNNEESTSNSSIGRSLLCQIVAKSENHEKIKTQDLSLIDDSDPIEEQEKEDEFQAWKLRELLRYKARKDEEERLEREELELKSFRNLPKEEQEKIWNERISQQSQSEKSKYEFLQKYYHKGAFFQDSQDEILHRDYDAPSQNESVDRSALPESMQVRNFGKKGRSKWTHLTKEDTTAFDSSWGDKKLSINYKMTSKMGGYDGRAFFDSNSKKRK